MKTAKSSAMRLLQRAFFGLADAGPSSIFDSSRRRFLKSGALASGAALFAPEVFYRAFGQSAPRVAIVGAGLGGLTTAWYLQKSGLKASVFEASHRVGGRTLSVRDTFGQGTATDLGGEFVDEWHRNLRELAAELDVEIYDLRQAQSLGNESVVFYDGRRISQQDIAEAIAPFRERLLADIARIPKNPTYRNLAPVQDLDALSVTAYLQKIGVNGWLAKYLNAIFTREYGLEANEQSALNMLYFLHLPAPGDEGVELIGGPGSEVMKIRGGSMAICEKIRANFSGEIQLNTPLRWLETAGDSYKLTFEDGKTTEADVVVLALPFTKLREIDLKITLSEPKRRAIAELGYGNSTKLVLGFKNPTKLKKGFPAGFSSDLPMAGVVYDAHPGQIPPNKEAALTLFTGGHETEALLSGDFAKNTQQCLGSLEPFFPGLKKRWNKKSMLWPWQQNEWSKAAYSTWRVGQWTAFAGAEGEPEGRVLFAGEHCSVDFQGFMEGAVESGRKAAEQILLKK